MYTEDKITFPKVQTRQLKEVEGWSEFQKNTDHINPEAYLFNVRKFSHKVYAQLDAFESEHRYVVWLDMDIIFTAQLEPGFLRKLVKDHFVAYLGRRECHTESGFLVFDTHHPDFRIFVERYRAMYDNLLIFTLDHWTDCHAFDHARQGLQAKNLTPDAVGIMNVFKISPVSHIMTHDKGALKYVREAV